MTIRSKRHLSGTLAWALSLAALIFIAGLVATFLQETPDRALATIAAIAFVAGASGVVLNWRLGRAHSHALRDPLTGLPNRVLLEDRIEQALRRSRRTDERFTLIVVDLDGFKDVNDVRGHGAGDAVLRTLARRFESILRSSDTVSSRCRRRHHRRWFMAWFIAMRYIQVFSPDSPRKLETPRYTFRNVSCAASRASSASPSSL